MKTGESMRDDLSGLTALLAVSERRSFTAAAAELRVTPSAVSHGRSRARGSRRRASAPAHHSKRRTHSARIVSQLRPALEVVREAFASLGERRDPPAGLLRLSVPRVGYAQVLAPRLAVFLAEYPDIRVDLHLDDALANIVEQGFDAGIRLGEAVEREMVAVRVSEDQRMVVVG